MAALTRKADKDDESAATDRPDDPVEAKTPATEATIKVADHEIDVDIQGGRRDEDPDTAGTIRDLSAQQLQQVLKSAIEEQAIRGREQNRPFRDFDKETLLVLQHELRGELASR